MTNTPLRDKLVQWEHDLFAAAWKSGKSYPVARTEVVLAVNQYEEQALARLALFPELVKALWSLLEEARELEPHGFNSQEAADRYSNPGSFRVAQAVLDKAKAIEKEAKG